MSVANIQRLSKGSLDMQSSINWLVFETTRKKTVGECATLVDQEYVITVMLKAERLT